ncbi:hypothetical protein AWV79_12265 [Cupriavidus sp. UYMMa02A]|nr:hypothetical protein AWV79_12265 [Cupriavidus sp. UYMMa02A]
MDVFGAATMSERLKQPFAVDNRPGANSFIAAKAVSSASPDGYALWLSNMRHHLSGRPGRTPDLPGGQVRALAQHCQDRQHSPANSAAVRVSGKGIHTWHAQHPLLRTPRCGCGHPIRPMY